MKKLTLTLITLCSLAVMGNVPSFADTDKPAKPDCSAQETAAATAKKAIANVPKVDLSSCKDKKGTEKSDCEKPLNEQHAADVKAAALKFKDADQALKCCKDSKAAGCPAPAK